MNWRSDVDNTDEELPSDYAGDPSTPCRCAACGLVFTSVGPFDFHRIGKLHPRDPARDERRCRTPEELRVKGYEPNDLGQWRKPAPDDIAERMTRP